MNADVKAKAWEKGVKLWQIADALGIQDNAFSRKLRHELTAEEKEKIFKVIDGLARR